MATCCIGVPWRTCSISGYWAPPPRAGGSVSLGWGLRVGISNKLLCDAHAADLINHLTTAGIVESRTDFFIGGLLSGSQDM